MTSSVAGLRKGSKAKLAPKKKDMVTVWWSAAGLIHYSFGETITSEKYAQQTRWEAPKIATPAASIGQQKGPIFLHDNCRLHVTEPMLQKLSELGHEVLPQPPYSTDLLQTNYTSSSILTTFCRENTSAVSRRQKNFPRVHQGPKAWILHYRMKPTYFSLAKMCWLKWFLFWINKCFCSQCFVFWVFFDSNRALDKPHWIRYCHYAKLEPSYNDFKFMVQNHNYFFIN